MSKQEDRADAGEVVRQANWMDTCWHPLKVAARQPSDAIIVSIVWYFIECFIISR